MKTDVVIIGAGVVGCAVARELTRFNVNVTVLEAGSDVAKGASKANSAIVHAGFDAKPGTNKAKFNVLGNRMFEDVCRELKVPFRRNGSLVLAFGAEDERTLAELKARGEQNGVPTEIVDPAELRRREPNVSPEATAALWAPTGELMWDIPPAPNPSGFWPLPKREKPKFVHMNGYGPDYRGFHIPAAYDETPKFEGKLNLAVDTESFHTFGMLWEPNGYSIYVDGRLRGRNRAAVSHVPEFVLLSTEAKWYRNNRMTGKGVPELEAAAAAGDDFVVDYVRVYDIAE